MIVQIDYVSFAIMLHINVTRVIYRRPFNIPAILCNSHSSRNSHLLTYFNKILVFDINAVGIPVFSEFNIGNVNHSCENGNDAVVLLAMTNDVRHAKNTK